MTDGLPPRRVLVITGAGASYNLGADDRPIPLMSGWATALIEAMGIRAQQVGISPNMPGDQFEAQLGKFLAFEQALPLIGDFGHLGALGNPGMGVDGPFTNWLTTTQNAVAQIRQMLWENLFRTFGRQRVDETAAATAYSRLHAAIRRADGSGPESYLAHATTNYDTAIETAVEQDERMELEDGFRRRPGGGSERYIPSLLTSAIQDSTKVVPVVHIHGAVGWYFDANGDVSRLPAYQLYDDRRQPALLLPDDTKSPETFTAAAAETWGQFTTLFDMSTHVLFVGHSLHDHHIVKAVGQSGKPTAVVAHVAPDEDGSYPEPDEASVESYRVQLPGVTVISGTFGQSKPHPDLDEAKLVRWLQADRP